ncbi:MAG: hypothetical protein RIB60_10650 [Phycisphaerales bacterium]
MPSPLAHTSLALLAAPTLARPNLALWALVIVFLLLPDADIAVGLVTTGDGFAAHGSWSHSFVLAPIAGLAFAFGAHLLARVPMFRGFLVGTALYASHVALDAITFGRGVGMFWPIVPERISAPITIFSGVRHSEPMNFAAHARTLAEELIFVIAVGLVAWGVARVRAGSRRTAEAAP